jgi:molecular chaperone GrpE
MMGDSESFPGYTLRDRRWWVRPQEESSPESSSDAQTEPSKPTHVAALEAELADRDRRLREAAAREHEAVREVDEARRRLERDARKEIERARRDLVSALLPVLDDLDRAIASAREAGTASALVTGVEHVRSGFLERLRGFGVERFDPTGDRFDPVRHDAVATVPASHDVETGVIVTTLRPGYAAGGETIRPAQVIVTSADGRSHM